MNGIARLKRLAEGQEDISLLRIVEHLTNMTDLSEKYLNEEKSLKSMIDYIKNEAKKLCKDNFCWVDDNTVYEWAVNYWSKTDGELGIKVATPKPKVEVKKEEVEPEVQRFGQLSLF